MKKGIQFTTDGNSRRAQIIPYHCQEYGRGERPAPIFKVESEPCDIAGLKCREASSEIVNATGQAKFRIGFEIEKNSFSGRTASGSRMTELALVQTAPAVLRLSLTFFHFFQGHNGEAKYSICFTKLSE